jgi:ADP-heptose:LPS heptosyltransferase
VQQVSNLTIVLTGGWDNELTAHTIGKACPDVINLCCKTTLEETAAILHFAVMLISTDTGVMHLGFAVGCPTLALLHYKNPATMVGPLDNSAGHEVIELTAPVDFKTSSVAAMQGIPDEAVRDAIVRMLLKKGIFLENLALLP